MVATGGAIPSEFSIVLDFARDELAARRLRARLLLVALTAAMSTVMRSATLLGFAVVLAARRVDR